ncbi:glycosyltransferase [Chloroflexota bacterium]
MNTVNVSIIVATYNNAPFLKQSIDSVLKQTYQSWELIIVDDASTDSTQDILREYEKDGRIEILINERNLGLTKSCNIALGKCRGEYIMRLDGDDFLDEHAIAILTMILDSKPDVDLVDCDHFLVDEDGDVIEYVRRKKLYDEVEVLDLPPISTAVMIRRHCYDILNGYNEELTCQDTYDFWMRFIQKFRAYNINLPLWYYRQHGGTLTKNKERILEMRRLAKNILIDEEGYLKNEGSRVLAIIPMRAISDFPFKLALHQIANQPLISYVIQTALNTKVLDRVIVTTEDTEIANVARGHGTEVIIRPKKLAKLHTPIEGTILFVLKELERENYKPDIVVILNANSPLMSTDNIEEAINTLIIYKSDSVISVVEDKKLHYTHDKYGLTPLYRRRKVRLEREDLYEENGAIYVSRRDIIRKESFLGQTISHVIMTQEESTHIDTPLDLWYAEQLLEKTEKSNRKDHLHTKKMHSRD